MKKKSYMQPAITIVTCRLEGMVCGSVSGVAGTGKLNTDVDETRETDTYLSRQRSLWDEE